MNLVWLEMFETSKTSDSSRASNPYSDQPTANLLNCFQDCLSRDGSRIPVMEEIVSRVVSRAEGYEDLLQEIVNHVGVMNNFYSISSLHANSLINEIVNSDRSLRNDVIQRLNALEHSEAVPFLTQERQSLLLELNPNLEQLQAMLVEQLQSDDLSVLGATTREVYNRLSGMSPVMIGINTVSDYQPQDLENFLEPLVPGLLRSYGKEYESREFQLLGMPMPEWPITNVSTLFSKLASTDPSLAFSLLDRQFSGGMSINFSIAGVSHPENGNEQFPAYELMVHSGERESGFSLEAQSALLIVINEFLGQVKELPKIIADHLIRHEVGGAVGVSSFAEAALRQIQSRSKAGHNYAEQIVPVLFQELSSLPDTLVKIVVIAQIVQIGEGATTSIIDAISIERPEDFALQLTVLSKLATDTVRSGKASAHYNELKSEALQHKLDIIKDYASSNSDENMLQEIEVIYTKLAAADCVDSDQL